MNEVVEKVWLDIDNRLYLSNPAVESETLSNGVYRLEMDPYERLYLSRVFDAFTFDYKVYGLETAFVDRVVKTYANTKGNLGVLLNGVRGTGKTVSSKIIANSLNQPVVIVDAPFGGAVDFLSAIPQDITIFLDEYEKTFKESSVMLTIMDGVLNSDYRRVFLLTTNDLFVERNLLQRPSRVRYMKSFEDLSPKIVEEIVDDYLIHPQFKQDMMKFVSCLELITVDIVKAIIQETNIHEESPYEFADLFNVKKNSGKIDLYLLDEKGKRTPFLKNINVYPRPKFNKNDMDGCWVEVGNTYIGEILEVLSATAVVVKPKVRHGAPLGFNKPITLEFEAAETRHFNYMFGATDSEDANEPLIGEKVLELINKGENADGNELKKYDFTIDGFDVKSITPTKPASKKRGDITKLVSAAKEYKEYKGTISQG
jgi:hypothetical protein